MNHYTNKTGYNSIRAASPWHFRASQPPGDHPFGAYFTTLPPDHPKLARKLRIPKAKCEYLFSFVDLGDLLRLDGDRGDWIFYAPQDYDVEKVRQTYSGEREVTAA